MIQKSNDNYISLQQASELCDYSQEYLSLRARQGKIKAVKIGRNWVTTKEWINEYVKQIKNGNGKLGDGFVKKIEETKKITEREKRIGEIREMRIIRGKNKIEKIRKIISLSFSPVVQKSFALMLITILVSTGIVLAKPSIDFASVAISGIADDTVQAIEQFSDLSAEALAKADAFTNKLATQISDLPAEVLAKAEDNFIEFNFAVINTIDEYNNSISDTIIDTSEFISQSFVSTKSGMMATKENFNSSIENVKVNFQSGYEGTIFLGKEIPKRIFENTKAVVENKIKDTENNISQKIKNAENKIKNISVNTFLFLADATESVEYSFEVFGKYGNWLGSKASDISKSVSDAGSSISKSISDTYKSISTTANNTCNFIFNPWAKEKADFQIAIQDIESIEEFGKLKQEIISLQEKIATMEKDGLPQKEIIKEIQRITKIEPLKEITKEIRIIDDKSLADFKIRLSTIDTQLATINKWETDINDLQTLTAKIQSSPPQSSAVNAPIYIGSQGIQSGGSASFASLGVSGSAGFRDLGVGGSSSFGANSGDLFSVNSTATFNSAVTMLNGLTVGSSTLIIDKDGNLTTNQDITTTGTGNVVIAGDLTVGGAQTYSGAASFTSSSDTASGLSVNQQGTGNIIQLQDNGIDAFVISDGGQAVFTSTTSPQMSIKYDDDNKLDISVSSAGVATLDASSGEIHAATGDAFYTEGGNPIRESGEEILRGSVSVFLYGTEAQTSSTSFIKISKHFSNISSISFPAAYTGTTRVHRLVINYSDDIATDANSNWRVASADSSTIYSEFNLSGLANAILEEPTPYITEAITIPDTDWQIELKVPTDKKIRIFQIYLTAYDKVD